MYSLVGTRAIMENVVVLTSAGGSPPQSLGDLRTAYRERVSSAPYDREGTPGEPQFIGDGDALTRLVRGFPLTRRGGDEVSPAPEWRMAMVRDGWLQLREQDETLGAIAATVVDTVFVTGANWTGSMSETGHVGTLWIMPGQNWQSEEVVEAYLHELTHTLLFLDERRYGHFLPAASEVRVRSAIRRDVREYPAVVHSALVAAELLAWRNHRQTADSACSRLHGPTAELTARARNAHAQVLEEDRNQNLLTPRMRELIEQAGERIHADRTL